MRLTTLFLSVAALTAAASSAFADTTMVSHPADASEVTVATESSLASATWSTLIEDVNFIPYGTSYSPLYLFQRGISTDALRIQLFQYAGELCGAHVAAVDIATAPDQRALTRYLPDANVEFSMPGSTVYKVMIVMNQPLVTGGRCIVRTGAKSNSGDSDPVPAGFELAGAIHYTGGFMDQVHVALTAGTKVGAFLAKVPAFCGDLEVVEAGVITEGIYDRSNEVDGIKHLFEVNGGAGTRASALSLSLNGPATLTCDIPVYVKRAP